MTCWVDACLKAAVVTIFLSASLTALSARGWADEYSCATPVSHGTLPKATDCLFILRAAVGAVTCSPECICRPTGGDEVTPSDALVCLRAAVGQPFSPDCNCPTTTTSTTLPRPAGVCEFSGADCHSMLECAEICYGSCSRAREACYAVAKAAADVCFAKCAAGDQSCPRRCVLEMDSYRLWCNRIYADCSSPCKDELCDGLNDGARLEDTGLTIIDHETALEWEKKTVENSKARYTWSSGYSSTIRDGTVFTEFLSAMNDPGREGGCYAGHCDWRLPTSAGERNSGEHAELESLRTLVYCTERYGCIDPLFGPVASDYYWSSTTSAQGNTTVWVVQFGSSLPRLRDWPKYFSGPARAVRELR